MRMARMTVILFCLDLRRCERIGCLFFSVSLHTVSVQLCTLPLPLSLFHSFFLSPIAHPLIYSSIHFLFFCCLFFPCLSPQPLWLSLSTAVSIKIHNFTCLCPHHDVLISHLNHLSPCFIPVISLVYRAVALKASGNTGFKQSAWQHCMQKNVLEFPIRERQHKVALYPFCPSKYSFQLYFQDFLCVCQWGTTTLCDKLNQPESTILKR